MNRVASGMNLVASGGNEGRIIFKKDSIGHIIVLNRVTSGPRYDCPIKKKETIQRLGLFKGDFFLCIVQSNLL